MSNLYLNFYIKKFIYFMCMVAYLKVCTPHVCSTVGGLKRAGHAEVKKRNSEAWIWTEKGRGRSSQGLCGHRSG